MADVHTIPGGKYLTFFLGDEEYGVSVSSVREIIALAPVTPVPRTPDFVRGVVNLRGKVLAVLDMRARFGMPAVAPTDETCIVIVTIGEEEVGIVVDRVSEVLDIPTADIFAPPALGTSVPVAHVLGIARAGERARVLLDADELLGIDERDILKSTAGAGA